ncbi:EAL domain-containing protein [Pseudomonas gingeri]|uniref:cyclic-guanylate-specific phosphodiesterase n=1 Tax=Pseudomonas gingeri TaxID=117681 RepID=A0A7Y8CK62_9PSED|nr:EAL domain-containing protein [Pseudomonas gingeri]NWB26566.1 EAL domain-containing protein [Pseudomonas gingeri]NWC32884.1 EAL domain-containing protein [Pseudomonas gingeri]NWD52931.1 EAL domain-containing protein [Pseudomonas gingeri]
MPLTVKGSRSRPARYGLSLLIGLLPIVSGIAILHWQADRALNAHSRETADDALKQFELMLDNAELSAHAIVPLAGRPCAEVELALREQVTRRPFVRAANLAWNNNLYCTSLFGPYQEVVNPADYVGGRLWLMDGNPVTPKSSLLVLRLAQGNGAAMVSIDGYHLGNLLRLIGREAGLVLQVGNVWISGQGQVVGGKAPAFAVAQASLHSTRFPFSVSAGFPEGEAWRYVGKEYLELLVLLLILGVLAGITTRWLQKRSGAPSHELQRALEAREFVPYFQPVVHSDTLKWSGLEVLMRWNHPREGLVRPDLFIPFAEHSGLIVPMTRSLLQQTAALLAPHSDEFEPGFHVGVNITASHCHDLQLVEDCRQFLAAFAPGQIRLVLELTERELIEPSAITHQLFEQLHSLGVMVAIDDFGTGHSSLNYLRKFNVDYLKIDQSFVAMIGLDALSRHILDSIIELSGKLELGIVAEGVETAEQRDYLASRGVDFLQGYLFGKPLPAADFLSSLKQQHAD